MKTEFSTAELDGLLTFSSYEEMANRPKFRRQVDGKATKPIKLLGTLPDAKEAYHCGLSTCRAPQRTSYLALCDDDTETNIGTRCGQIWLGIESFAEIRSDFNRRSKQKYTLDVVRNAVKCASEYQAIVENLVSRAKGTRWLVERMREFERALPPILRSEIKTRAMRNEVGVVVPKRRTDAELKAYDATHVPPDGDQRAQSRYEQSEARLFAAQPLGLFMGLEVLKFDGRRVVFQDLKLRVDELEKLLPDSMTGKDRSTWSKWIREFDSTVAEVERWLDSGVRFFGSTSNYELLLSITRDDAERRSVQRMRWDSEDDSVRVA